MTHNTDAARAEFEAWARGYGTWEVKRDDDVVLGTTGYTDITLTVAWHAVQAAHRAPAAPVPLRKPTVAQVTDAIGYHASAWDCVDPCELIDAILILAAAPQPPEAAPVRKPLTDAQIEGLLINWPKDSIAFFDFARAIERAHGIGGAA